MFLAAIGLHDWAPKVGLLSKLWRPKRDFRKSIPIQNSCWIDEMRVKPKNIFQRQTMYKITILCDFARDLISLKKKKSPQTIHFFHFFSQCIFFLFSVVFRSSFFCSVYSRANRPRGLDVAERDWFGGGMAIGGDNVNDQCTYKSKRQYDCVTCEGVRDANGS